MRQRNGAGRALLFLVVLLAACAPPPEGRTVLDALGRDVVVPPSPRRIVTLAPDVTEIVAHLGAADRLVGTDSASDHPPAIRDLPDVGGLQPNIESIAALEPDVVIASTSGNPPSLDPALRAAGIPLFVVRTARLTDIPRALRMVGDLLGTDASEAAARMEREIAAARRERTPAPRVLVMLWTDPMYVAGRETYLDDLLEIAGAENAVTTTGWPAISREVVVADPPDLILYPEAAVSAEALRSIAASAAWRSLPAVREGDVVPFEDDLLLRPGPRVTEGLAELNRILDEWERKR